MKIIKEFWEFSKNLYNHNGYVKKSHEILNSTIDEISPEEGKWFKDKNDIAIFIKSVEDGKYYGHNKDGHDIEGNVQDIRSELTNELYIGDKYMSTKKLKKEKLKLIGYGSEGEVYSDGEFAYKVINPDLVPTVKEIKNRFINHTCDSVVSILDAWEEKTKDGDTMIIIKMELLDDLDIGMMDDDYDEYLKVRDQLWYSEDNVDNIKNILKGIKSQKVRSMVQAIIDAKKCVGYLDVGFHNLMYDSKKDQYKQIDIF